MNMTITRNEAVGLLNKYVRNERMLNYCYASEAVIRALAHKLGRDEENGGLTGSQHDLDVEIVNVDKCPRYRKRKSLELNKVIKNAKW
jgi:predicted hydrolase (HD superfamily)